MEQTSNRFKNENKNKNKKQLHVYHNSAKFWEYNFCNSHLLYMYFTSEKIQTKYARYEEDILEYLTLFNSQKKKTRKF